MDEAYRAGADCIKFQTFRAKKLLTRAAAKAEYQKQTTAADESQYEMIRKLELSEADHRLLIERCRECGVEFLSSPFDEESADFLESLGVARFKVPSGEMTNLPFLRHLARKQKPLILSTGMSTLGEVEAAVNTIRAAGNDRDYPASLRHRIPRAFRPDQSARHADPLHVIRPAGGVLRPHPGHRDCGGGRRPRRESDRKAFHPGQEHGGARPPRLPRTAGAEADGPVHPQRRGVLGSGIKTPAACEIANRAVARKSLVAARSIRKGSRLAAADIAVKRPGNGIQPQDIDKVIGLEVTRDLEADEVITWESFK